MAVISPVRSEVGYNIEQALWETITESDTASSIQPQGSGPLAGSFQVVGTFGGATVVCQVSNDGTNWATAKDAYGTDISLTDAGVAEFTLSSLYIRPSASGGSSQDIDVYVVMRGS